MISHSHDRQTYFGLIIDLFLGKISKIFRIQLIYTNAHLSLNSRSSQEIAAGMFDEVLYKKVL